MREVAPVSEAVPPRPDPFITLPPVVRALAWAAVAVGFVFFTGWAYAYHYFAHFSVGLAALHLPAVAFFGFAFWAFQSVWWLLLPYALGALALAAVEPLLRAGWRRLRARRPGSLAQLAFVLVLAAFLLAWWVAGLGAGRFFERQRAGQFRDLPRARVWPGAAPEDEALRALYAELPTGIYRVLSEDRDRLFLFKPPAGAASELAVIELPWREVRAVQVLP